MYDYKKGRYKYYYTKTKSKYASNGSLIDRGKMAVLDAIGYDEEQAYKSTVNQMALNNDMIDNIEKERKTIYKKGSNWESYPYKDSMDKLMKREIKYYKNDNKAISKTHEQAEKEYHKVALYKIRQAQSAD